MIVSKVVHKTLALYLRFGGRSFSLAVAVFALEASPSGRECDGEGQVLVGDAHMQLSVFLNLMYAAAVWIAAYAATVLVSFRFY
ncbi:hypothetical protein OPV22_011998 [Ensete ventricosum]|uniref:CASP-like protein n=1 Tax=Ensete ventricosum TaxID=4639 RepID=A0AAV8R247_ENSVE|nr:hypothetical protein OPV22_011998 [Ensete ventricosum]